MDTLETWLSRVAVLPYADRVRAAGQLHKQSVEKKNFEELGNPADPEDYERKEYDALHCQSRRDIRKLAQYTFNDPNYKFRYRCAKMLGKCLKLELVDKNLIASFKEASFSLKLRVLSSLHQRKNFATVDRFLIALEEESHYNGLNHLFHYGSIEFAVQFLKKVDHWHFTERVPVVLSRRATPAFVELLVERLKSVCNTGRNESDPDASVLTFVGKCLQYGLRHSLGSSAKSVVLPLAIEYVKAGGDCRILGEHQSALYLILVEDGLIESYKDFHFRRRTSPEVVAHIFKSDKEKPDVRSAVQARKGVRALFDLTWNEQEDNWVNWEIGKHLARDLQMKVSKHVLRSIAVWDSDNPPFYVPHRLEWLAVAEYTTAVDYLDKFMVKQNMETYWRELPRYYARLCGHYYPEKLAEMFQWVDKHIELMTKADLEAPNRRYGSQQSESMRYIYMQCLVETRPEKITEAQLPVLAQAFKRVDELLAQKVGARWSCIYAMENLEEEIIKFLRMLSQYHFDFVLERLKQTPCLKKLSHLSDLPSLNLTAEQIEQVYDAVTRPNADSRESLAEKTLLVRRFEALALWGTSEQYADLVLEKLGQILEDLAKHDISKWDWQVQNEISEAARTRLTALFRRRPKAIAELYLTRLVNHHHLCRSGWRNDTTTMAEYLVAFEPKYLREMLPKMCAEEQKHQMGWLNCRNSYMLPTQSQRLWWELVVKQSNWFESGFNWSYNSLFNCPSIKMYEGTELITKAAKRSTWAHQSLLNGCLKSPDDRVILKFLDLAKSDEELAWEIVYQAPCRVLQLESARTAYEALFSMNRIKLGTNKLLCKVLGRFQTEAALTHLIEQVTRHDVHHHIQAGAFVGLKSYLWSEYAWHRLITHSDIRQGEATPTKIRTLLKYDMMLDVPRSQRNLFLETLLAGLALPEVQLDVIQQLAKIGKGVQSSKDIILNKGRELLQSDNDRITRAVISMLVTSTSWIVPEDLKQTISLVFTCHDNLSLPLLEALVCRGTLPADLVRWIISEFLGKSILYYDYIPKLVYTIEDHTERGNLIQALIDQCKQDQKQADSLQLAFLTTMSTFSLQRHGEAPLIDCLQSALNDLNRRPPHSIWDFFAAAVIRMIITEKPAMGMLLDRVQDPILRQSIIDSIKSDFDSNSANIFSVRPPQQ